MFRNNSQILRVATANVGIGRNIPYTVEHIEYLFKQASQNDKGTVDILVLPEICIPGYSKKFITDASQNEIEEALKKVQNLCKEFKIGCILGIPRFEEERIYNSACLIDRYGRIIGYQDKMQLVPADMDWGKWQYGESCNVFHIDSIPVGIIICHDKRFPELARLLVLGGARVIFYISCEQWHDDQSLLIERDPKWTKERLMEEVGVYRAQIQARAVENNVWVVKSNVAKDHSHGHSCVVDPFGKIIVEAGFDEEMVMCELDTSKATGHYASKSTLEEYKMCGWWKEGFEKFVKIHPPLRPPRK